MTLKEAYEKGTLQLEQSGIAEAELDAWHLLEHVTGISRALYLLDSKKEMDTVQETQYLALLEKRASHIPLQHLTGVQEFMGLEFQVNEYVLIPRQDTETLVETALDILQNGWRACRNMQCVWERQSEVQPGNEKFAESRDSICFSESNESFLGKEAALLDLCTGSGCILLSILKLLEKSRHFKVIKCLKRVSCMESSYQHSDPDVIPVWGTGIDISREALEIAGRNAERLGIETEFLQSDLFENVEGRFSMIVSNPPYIRTSEIQTLQEEVKKHEPVIALDGGEDGLCFYRKIIQESRQHLVPGGYLLFEIGYNQGAEVAKLMWDAGFRKIAVKKDLAGLDRVVSGMYDDRVELQ